MDPYGATGKPRMEPPIDISRRELPSTRIIGRLIGDSSVSGIVGNWVVVPKTADETIANDTTLSIDGQLQFTMIAGKKYHIRAAIDFETTAATDFKWALTGPAAPTWARVERKWIIPGGTAYAGQAIDVGYTGSQDILSAAGADGFVQFNAFVQNGVNGGAFGFQWAQVTSGAGPTIVRATSYLEYLEF